MSGAPTPAHDADAALKPAAVALDSAVAMRIHDLRLRVERAEYPIDPHAVANAMLRHAISQRRWWNPDARCSTPPADSTTPAPAATDPTHVSATARSAASRSAGATQTHSS